MESTTHPLRSPKKRVYKHVTAPATEEGEVKLRAAVIAAESGKSFNKEKKLLCKLVERWLDEGSYGPRGNI